MLEAFRKVVFFSCGFMLESGLMYVLGWGIEMASAMWLWMFSGLFVGLIKRMF